LNEALGKSLLGWTIVDYPETQAGQGKAHFLLTDAANIAQFIHGEVHIW
jgi:hypothetical protein